MSASAVAEDARFDHDAFVYDSDDDYIASLAPMIVAALERGDDVHAVVPPRNEELLQRALPPSAAAQVKFVDAREWYRRPGTTITQYDDVLTALEGRKAFVVGEVEFGTTPREWAAWTRYESVLNGVLAHHTAHVICPYDRRQLPPMVTEWAAQSHPHLVGGSECLSNLGYVRPQDLLTLLPPEVEPPMRPADTELDAADVRTVRRAVASAARAARFTDDRAAQLVMAVNEVATNALVHGAGWCVVRLWSQRAELTCVVEDSGPGLDDPLAGYIRPEFGSPNGYGLWLARQSFDFCSFTRGRLGGLQVTLAAHGSAEGLGTEAGSVS